MDSYTPLYLRIQISKAGNLANYFGRSYDGPMIKKISLSTMIFAYLFVGISHFTRFSYFLSLVPPFIPSPKALVALMGCLDILVSILLAFQRTRRRACIGIILLLILGFPLNLYLLVSGAAGNAIPHDILVGRIPFQIFLMLWAYWHSRDGLKGAA